MHFEANKINIGQYTGLPFDPRLLGFKLNFLKSLKSIPTNMYVFCGKQESDLISVSGFNRSLEYEHVYNSPFLLYLSS